jgi:drug/metabolite transporter (DMT)-like permease
MYIILGAFVGISINVSAFFIGLLYAPSINVHVISSVGPLVLYFLSIIILHEKPHPHVLRGMIIAFTGVIIAIFLPLLSSIFQQGGSFQEIVGNALYVIAMFSVVGHAVLTKKVIRQFDTVMFTGVQAFIGAIPFFFLMIYEMSSSTYHWSVQTMELKGWVGIIYGIFFSSALAYWAYNYALKKLSAQEVGVYSYAKPIVAVLVAIPLLSEYPDIYFMVGAVLVFIGIWISERHPHFHRIHKKMHGRG